MANAIPWGDDERTCEELKLRAQTFGVPTGGGDFAADLADGQDNDPKARGRQLGVTLVPLPPQMIRDLRVPLVVWTDYTNAYCPKIQTTLD